MCRTHDRENLGNGRYRWVAHVIVKILETGLQMGRAHDCENLGNGSYRGVAQMIVKTLETGATDGSRT
jgi:hypothetical protein